jgi:hypothetical protein
MLGKSAPLHQLAGKGMLDKRGLTPIQYQSTEHFEQACFSDTFLVALDKEFILITDASVHFGAASCSGLA